MTQKKISTHFRVTSQMSIVKNLGQIKILNLMFPVLLRKPNPFLREKNKGKK